MIIHDGKKAAGLILSRMNGEGKDSNSEVTSDYDAHGKSGGDDHLRAIAEDMFMAMEKKDPHLLVTALKAFMGCIETEDEKQDKEMGMSHEG